MSTDINETRTGQDPEHEQAEQEWSSDEAGAAVEDPTAEGYESERGDDERAEGERDGDETESGDTRFGQDLHAFAYTTNTNETDTDEDADAEQSAESVEALHGLDDADTETETAEGGEQSAESVEGLRGLDGTETAEGAEPSESVESDESDEPVESGHDGSAAADAEQFPAYGDLAQDPTSVPATDVAGDEQPLASDEAVDETADESVNADADIARSNGIEDPAHEDSAQVPEGVAKPEDLGGRNIGAGADPLVDAEAQQEFLSRWTRIQISFLEDPTAAVESADALIQEIGAAVLSALEERGGELASAGRAASDTEQQRLALRQYRAYIGVLLPQ
jgi:hypothetical protein